MIFTFAPSPVTSYYFYFVNKYFSILYNLVNNDFCWLNKKNVVIPTYKNNKLLY